MSTAEPIQLGVLVPVLSIYPRCPNGGFSKADRFFDPSIVNDTPGPNYNLPSVFSEHVAGPVYKADTTSIVGSQTERGSTSKRRDSRGGDDDEKEDDDHNKIHLSGSHTARVTGTEIIPHPTKDRTAWMIGITKNDLAYYSQAATAVGPAFYSPNSNHVKPVAPRNVFPKNPRFTSLTHQYISRDHNLANLCTASPGPRYMPPVGQIDLVRPYPPEFSFGGKGLSGRASFLSTTVKDGYLYTARPATSDPHVNISPAQYTPRAEVVATSPPKPVWTRGERFGDANIRYISKGHTRSKIGVNGPGPAYYPHNNEIFECTKLKSHPPRGKWCP